MCTSEWSSQIAGEILDNPNEEWVDTPKQKIIELDNDTWELLDQWIPYVRRVFMTGGEPTIIKRNLDYINKIITSGHSRNVELNFYHKCHKHKPKFYRYRKKF
jgi:organic radical activating enzyme